MLPFFLSTLMKFVPLDENGLLYLGPTDSGSCRTEIHAMVRS